jgi:hypothetical protein
VYLELDKLDGYKINPKATKEGSISVSKIIFINDSMTEKLIRKKIDKKINYLLSELKKILEDENPDEDGIKRSLMDAEKLKLQIINNYVKYLGHTYQSLTLKKIQIIINQLRFKLYTIRDMERENNLYFDRDSNGFEYEERETRRGR